MRSHAQSTQLTQPISHTSIRQSATYAFNSFGETFCFCVNTDSYDREVNRIFLTVHVFYSIRYLVIEAPMRCVIEDAKAAGKKKNVGFHIIFPSDPTSCHSSCLFLPNQ